MIFTVIWVGKTGTSFIKEQIEFYLKRISHTTTVNLIEVKESPLKDPVEKSNKEAEDIIRKLPKSAFYLILLDEIGKEYTSKKFSEYLTSLKEQGKREIIFLIGGAYGHGKKIREIANSSIALSKMTFTHEMVRPFLLEQIYRALQIEKGTGYHHE